MRFDPDRLEVLAGITSHSNYRYKKLNEMEAKIVLTPEDEEEQGMVSQLTSDLAPDEVEVETVAGLAGATTPGPEPSGAAAGEPMQVAPEEELDLPPEEDVAELPPEELEEPIEEPMEETLRRIIRTEVRHIVSEEIAKRDERQIETARRNKSVATAMGFSSSITKPQSNKRWSPTMGFPGPGFKR